MIRSVAADGRPDLGGVFTPIERPRVLDRIAAAARYRIAAIVAPAGFGKSVAVRQFLATIDSAIVYEITRENRTLTSFVRGFVDALAPRVIGLAQSFPVALQHAGSSENASRELALWMRIHLRAFHGLIVLDDLHLCDDERDVSIFLTTLLESTDGPRWLISSRSSANLPIASWLAYGEMDLAIDAVDLRFTIEEARENARSSRVAVREDELQAILNLVEGWPTALSFALRSSTRAADMRAVSASTREMAYRYLTEQVYQSLDSETREFLRFAALLPRLDLKYAHAAKFDRAAAIVAGLRESVAFISAIDATSFRLHDLFRDFIRRQLELEGTATFRQALVFAGSILEDVGEPGHALERYIEAKDLAQIARLLEKDGLDLIDFGQADVVDRAIAMLGKSLQNEEAALVGVRAALDHYHGRSAQAKRLYERALAATAHSASQRTIAIRYARMLADTQGEPAIPLLERLLLDETMADSERAELLGMLAVHQAISGSIDDAACSIDRAMIVSELGTDALRARIYGRACGIAMFQKDHAAVERLGKEAVRLATASGHFGIASRTFGLMCADSYWDIRNRSASHSYAAQSTDFAMKSGDIASWLIGLSFEYYCAMERGDVDRLVRLDRDFSLIRSHASANVSATHEFARAMRAAWRSDFAGAHQLMRGIPAVGLLRQVTFIKFVRLSIFYALDGRNDDARAALAAAETAHAALRPDAPAEFDGQTVGARWLIVANILLCRKTIAARQLRACTNEGPAVPGFDAAIRALIDEDPVGFRDGLIRMRTEHFGGVAELLEIVASHLAANTLESREGLTAMELAVLRAMASGRSNKAIADEQNRTINTVRTHVSSVLRKLNAKTRGEAVAAARQRSIIDS